MQVEQKLSLHRFLLFFYTLLIYALTIGKLKGFRYIDDYYLFFDSLSKAELALSSLHSVLRKYELELNTNKLSIIELPDALESRWLIDLRAFPLTEINSEKATYLIDYFSMAFESAKKYPNEFVLKYALSKIKEYKISEDNWKIYEAIIINTIMADASIIPIATEIFLTYDNMNYPLDKTKILNTLSEIINYSCTYNHTFELFWSLWLIKTLKLKINQRVVNSIKKNNNSMVSLVFLDLINSGLITHRVDLTYLKPLLNKDELYTENWLLAYEANVKGWIRTRSDYVSSDNFFQILKANNVVFYDISKQVSEISLKEDTEDSDDSGSYF